MLPTLPIRDRLHSSSYIVLRSRLPLPGVSQASGQGEGGDDLETI